MKFAVFCPAVLFVVCALFNSQTCVKAVPIANIVSSDSKLDDNSDVLGLAQWNVSPIDLSAGEQKDQFDLGQLYSAGIQDDDIFVDHSDFAQLAKGSPISQKDEKKKGLSGGAIAGIVIGALALCCIAVIMMKFCEPGY